MPHILFFATCCVCLELRPLPCASITARAATGSVTRFQQYYGPLRHPKAPGLSLAGIRLVIADPPKGFPCCVRFPCVHAPPLPRRSVWGCPLLVSPTVAAFPDRVVGSACASSFSRFARRSLALPTAHSRCHQFVTRFTRRLQAFRFLHSCSGCFRLEHFAGRGSHPLESATL